MAPPSFGAALEPMAHRASFRCTCGHNIRKILAHLRARLAWIFAAILNAAYHPGRKYHAGAAA